MPNWSKIIGTIEQAFQIGLGGPRLKNNAGAIDARDASDQVFVNVRVADAVVAEDAVNLRTLNQALGLPPASSMSDAHVSFGSAQVGFGSAAGGYSNG